MATARQDNSTERQNNTTVGQQDITTAAQVCSDQTPHTAVSYYYNLVTSIEQAYTFSLTYIHIPACSRCVIFPFFIFRIQGQWQ